MIDCERCGSMLGNWGDPHECFPLSPPCNGSSPGIENVSNVAVWEEHNRRIRELSVRFPELSFAEVLDLALSPASTVEAVGKAA
jgi:hypothetical protein